MFGNSLLSSFGLDPRDPAASPDLARGYEQARSFLTKVCTAFTDPTHIIGIAPFSYAYLGEKTFNDVLEIVLTRSQSHPKEQPLLDEIFTAASLLHPTLRSTFLGKVQQAKSLEIDDESQNKINGCHDSQPEICRFYVHNIFASLLAKATMVKMGGNPGASGKTLASHTKRFFIFVS